MPLRKKPLSRKHIRQNFAKEEGIWSRLAKFKDHVEVIGKIILGVVAFCYAVGILVESLYLGSFGVYHVSLFRFTYVIAGAWALIFFTIPALIIFVGGYLTLLANSQFKKIRGIAIDLKFWYVMLFLILFLVHTLASISDIKIDLPFSVQIVLSVIVGGAMVGFFVMGKHYKEEDIRAILPLGIFASMLILFAFAAYVVFFSTKTFPQISARFGGGKPLTVQLVLEVNKQNAWMIQKNFELCDTDKIKLALPNEVQLIATKPMALLIATDKDYIIRKDENTAISISRDQVKTVLYLDKVDPNVDVCAQPPVEAPAQ